MELIAQLALIVILLIIAMIVVSIMNPNQRYAWQRRSTVKKDENFGKSFYPTIKDKRVPDGKQSSYVTLSGQYREEYWGSIYWLDSHPTNEDLQAKHGLNRLILQHWKFHGEGNWQDSEQLKADMQRHSDRFYNHHVKTVLAELEKQGWQKSGEWRTVRKIADLNGGSLSIINLTQTS